MYKIAKSNLPALFRAIAETKELYLPIRRAGQVNFGPWSEDAEVDVETLKTVKSPKDVFFPQSENLYSCEREGKDIKIEPQALQDQEFVVFGMKACDIKGVEVLDKSIHFMLQEEITESSLPWHVMNRKKAVSVRYLA